MGEQTFPMIPAGSGVYYVIAPALLILLAVAGLMGYLAFASKHVRFDVSPHGLHIAGDIYGRTIPHDHLVVDRGRAVNLKQEPNLRLAARTNGSGLPGYAAGWFRLKDGEKVLAFVTDQTRVVYLPTTDGYALLLSVADPNAFLDAVRQTVPAHS